MTLFLNKKCLGVTLMLVSVALAAQSPVPAPRQSGAILIMGATAHLGNGQSIPNSAIAFENGKLTLVADATTIRPLEAPRRAGVTSPAYDRRTPTRDVHTFAGCRE